MLYPTADAYLADDPDDMNFGDSTSLVVGYSGGIDQFEYQSLLRFDLSQIPYNANITAAYLGMYQDTMNPGSLQQPFIAVYLVTEDWCEGPFCTDRPPVNWNHRPQLYPLPPAGTQVDTTTLGWKMWDMRGPVRIWLAGSLPNYGMALIGAATSDYLLYFSSREGTEPPVLLVYVTEYSYLPLVTR